MPDPGSHGYDIKRTRLRDEYDDRGVPDQHADHAANAELERDHPPRRVGDPDRAAGPKGDRGTSRGDPELGENPRPTSGELELRSSAFTEHTLLPNRFAYERQNISPPLEWQGVPDGTQELVLLCEDPDAPGGTFTHWVVLHLPPESAGLREGELPPEAVTARNSFGEHGWGGPQPPVGDEPHRYFFRLHAVDRRLSLDAGATADTVHEELAGHTLATGTLVGRYAR